jgi:ubiquinone biosynthesis protein
MFHPGVLGWLQNLPESTRDRIQAVAAFLDAPANDALRGPIGNWVTRLIPTEALVPQAYQRWRPLVQDAMEFVFSRLSSRRLAAKIVEQFELPADTPPERRLLELITKMPGLQKLGQVLARNRRISKALRSALSELENGMSDVTPHEIRAIIAEQLGGRLERYAVEIEPRIFSEASVSAVMRFTWNEPGRERERGVFKVLKPYVPDCFGEDMTVLQELGDYLAGTDRGYGFAIHDVKEMLAEVRMLLEPEVDFRREQATLVEAHRAYRGRFGIRVPRLFRPLCTGNITAMSEESGVKVTEAFPRSPVRRQHIAAQIIEALLAVPLFSRANQAIFHADPHAGNLFYNEPDRELVVLDWALAERLNLETRRRLIMLALAMIWRNPDGVRETILALSRRRGRRKRRERVINAAVDRFFAHLPQDHSPGALDAMLLLDDIALHGVSFPACLFMFRKILFTLDGVLHDVAGPGVRIDNEIAREFVTRWIASCGLFFAPLRAKDFLTAGGSALAAVGRQISAVGTQPG